MKKLLIFIIGFLSIKTISDSGAFKEIRPHYSGKCKKIINISGPEDITILNNGLALISSDDRRATLKGVPVQGHIYSYNLNDKYPELNILTSNINFEFHPHGIAVYEKEQSALVLVVNHRTEENTIEVFHLINNKLIYQNTLRDPLLISPNDIVAINDNQFYVTNDHGSSSKLSQLFEDYLQLSRSNVLYFDGIFFNIAVSDLKYANGINLSNDKTKIYIAETTGRRISIYNRKELTNELIFEESIYLKSGVDNIEIDNENNLWIGSHPQVLKFVKHAKDEKYDSPSQVMKIIVSEEDDHIIKEIYLDGGNELSGSSVAAVYKNILLIGAVFEDCFLFCHNN